jgi:PadR family transcriptional regulator PadR
MVPEPTHTFAFLALLTTPYIFTIMKYMRTETLLSSFELLVMLALIRLGDDAYGVPISREIEERSGRIVSLTTIYAALERLEGKGFVTSEMGEPTSERGGRAKRYFTITPKGIREVRDVKVTLMNMWKGLPNLGGEKA